MARYKLLIGQYITDIDGKEVTLRPGAEFDSDIDLLQFNGRNGMQPKFELLSGRAALLSDPNVNVWDPKVETLDEFVARMKEPKPSGIKAKLLAMDASELRELADQDGHEYQDPEDKEELARLLMGV